MQIEIENWDVKCIETCTAPHVHIMGQKPNYSSNTIQGITEFVAKSNNVMVSAKDKQNIQGALKSC